MQLCILFYANYTILATQRGGHGAMSPPLNTPLCQRKLAFVCADNSLILGDLFCDGMVDCNDGSNEVKNQSGFQCNGCVLPQTNSYDDLAQCDNGSDMCNTDNVFCFQCFDKHFAISSTQLCDGVNDCNDASDECACPDKNFSCFYCIDNSRSIPSHQVCDNVNHCDDLSDEYLCSNSSSRCFQCLDNRSIIF